MPRRCQKLVVIVGHKAEEVKAALAQHSDVEFALQADQKGTGHAVMMSADSLSDHVGPVLVLAGDTPPFEREFAVTATGTSRRTSGRLCCGNCIN